MENGNIVIFSVMCERRKITAPLPRWNVTGENFSEVSLLSSSK